METDFYRLLRQIDVVIGYTPIGDEPHFQDFLKEKNATVTLTLLPPHREHSPHDTARTLRETYVGKRVYIFIPGREFDFSGTRHGRGGGWYDRFLSEVPREWFRIGTLNASQLSEKPLLREPWDEPMDFLLVYSGGLWNVAWVEI